MPEFGDQVPGLKEKFDNVDSALGAKPSAVDVETIVNAMLATVGAAAGIGYDNTTSGLASDNVQAAIDELAAAPGGGGLSQSQILARQFVGC